MADGSGSNAILGVIVGALLVLILLFLVFGGADFLRGGGNDVTIELPAPTLPGPGETPAPGDAPAPGGG